MSTPWLASLTLTFADTLSEIRLSVSDSASRMVAKVAYAAPPGTFTRSVYCTCEKAAMAGVVNGNVCVTPPTISDAVHPTGPLQSSANESVMALSFCTVTGKYTGVPCPPDAVLEPPSPEPVSS